VRFVGQALRHRHPEDITLSREELYGNDMR
jgi:hypothetical protein